MVAPFCLHCVSSGILLTGAPGAIASHVGGTATAQADDEGGFRITLPATDVTLLVRSIGYRRAEVRVSAAQEAVEIGLTRDVQKLDEGVLLAMERLGSLPNSGCN